MTVLLGTSVGLLLGRRFDERLRRVAVQALGLVTLLIGVQMALQVQNLLILVASVVAGALLGTALRLEQRLTLLGVWLEARTAHGNSRGDNDGDVVRAFVTSSLVFCVGPLTILGAIQDGLLGDPRLLSVKALLDGISSIAFASALGRGVYLSIAVILVYQGGLSLAARLLGTGIVDPTHNAGVLEMTAAGGLMVVALGLRLLDVQEIPVADFLPSLVLAPLLTWLAGPLLARLVLPA